MNRIEKLLTKIRYTLADIKKERWSDERLISLIDEAQKDICRRAKLLRSKASFVVFNGYHTFKLPDDLLLLDKASINNLPLDLIGYTELDQKVVKWEEMEGEVKSIVYDKQSRGLIRLFPIPKYTENDNFVVVPSYNSYAYGKIRDTYGVIANVCLPGEILNGNYGVTSEITGIFQWVEEEFGMPKVIVKDYELSSPYGIAVDIMFNAERNEPIDLNRGIITQLQGFEVDKFGVSSEINEGGEKNIYFSNNFGEGVAFNSSDVPGYFTYFKTNGEISDVLNGAKVDLFGFLSEVGDIDKNFVEFNSPYGLTADAVIVKNILDVWYIRKPKEIDSIYSEIEIDDCFDNAIKYFVCGKAFRDDLDAQNRQMGAEELQLYERELKEAESDDSSNFTSGYVKGLAISYNGGGFI